MSILSSFGGLAAIGRHARSQAPFIADGGTITVDGEYTVHTFTSGGTFTVISGVSSIEVAVVGGGGGGGCIDGYGCGGITGWAYGAGGEENVDGATGPNYAAGSQNSAGGGGGGGCAQWATLSITASTTVTVGAAGAVAGNGGASVFGTVTSNGGTKGFNAPSHLSTGGAGGPKGTGTGGSTTPGSIAIPASYGHGGHGASQGWGAQPGNPGVVIVRYKTGGM